MKKYLFILIAVAFSIVASTASDNDIRLNSIGFLPDAPKKATIITECANFELIDVISGKSVFSGKTQGPVFQENVKQNVWIADFSAYKKEGNYKLSIPDVGKSVAFKIGKDVYNEAFYTVFRGLYLWRCGTEVETKYKGDIFHQEACHLNDGYEDYIGNEGGKRDGTGGWHDAGDYGKYVVNAGVSLGVLFNAWIQYEKQLTGIDFDIPESATGLPDFLEEMKYETDWLLKMPYPDGSGRVSHKLTRLNFSGFIMPSADDGKRYFSEWGTSATASFTAMMAMTSRVFEKFDPEYAKTCLDAAKNSYNFLKENTDYKRFVQGKFSTGGYQTQDWDDRIWAAAELWEATGDNVYLEDLESRLSKLKIKADYNWDWETVTNLAVATYLSSKRKGRNEELVQAVKKDFIAVADTMVKSSKNDVYGRPLGNRYYWGCNGTLSRQVMNLQMACQMTKDEKYRNASLDAISHVFGRNYYNRSYVTGLGINPPMHPHDRRSGADGIENPWPGYIVGGGHTATDWVDEQESYSHNEIALNWQAALIYALSGFYAK